MSRSLAQESHLSLHIQLGDSAFHMYWESLSVDDMLSALV